MQKLIFVFLIFLAAPIFSFAQSLEAKPLADLVSMLEKTEFQYKETGLMFGYNNVQSCLFVSETIAVLKNYCFPKKTYPARGYTIISAKFGIIELYEEQWSHVLQRDVMIMAFPEAIAAYLPTTLAKMDVQKINAIMNDLYPKYLPACWSTNYSVYTELPEAKCTVNSSAVTGFQDWATETQTLTLDKDAWLRLIKKLENLF